MTQQGTPEHEHDPDRPGPKWVQDDDLLTGLDRAGRPRGVRAFFAATLGAALLVWNLTFSLGAYHTVFYWRLFQIFVVATVLLLGAIVLRDSLRVRLWMKVLLAVPMLWVVVRVIAFAGNDYVQQAADIALGILVVISMPFTLLAAARIVSPEYFALQGRRFKVIAVGIVALVAVSGFLVGQFNYVFTTCQDYVVAGDNQPGNCNHSTGYRPNRP